MVIFRSSHCRHSKKRFRAIERSNDQTIIAALTLAMLTSAASAQQRTFYDSRGNVVGRSATDSSGAVTNYDSCGRVISRESTSGNTTTVYDAGGRNVTQSTPPAWFLRQRKMRASVLGAKPAMTPH
jgi:YD repeat-containing protein